MAGTEPRLPEQFRSAREHPEDFNVSEFAADMAGSLSPYGQDVDFPLPLSKVRYTHPGPADRPHLADGR